MPLGLGHTFGRLAAAFLVDWTFELVEAGSAGVALGLCGRGGLGCTAFYAAVPGSSRDRPRHGPDGRAATEDRQRPGGRLAVRVAGSSTVGVGAARARSHRLRGRVRQRLERLRRFFPAGAGPAGRGDGHRGAAGLAVAVLLAVCVRVSQSFFARFGTLSHATSIDQILVNGKPVTVSPGRATTSSRRPTGGRCGSKSASSGELPEAGRVELETVASSLNSTLDLPRAERQHSG